MTGPFVFVASAAVRSGAGRTTSKLSGVPRGRRDAHLAKQPRPRPPRRIRDHATRRLRRRRRLLQGLAAGAALAATRRLGAGRAGRASGRPWPGRAARWPAPDDGQAHALRRRHQLQQLLRIRHRQVRPGAPRRHAEDAALDGGGRGRGAASPAPGTSNACSSSAPMEERIYRLRCVEGWSMVIPWVGYSLAELIKPASNPPATRSSSSS